MAPRFANRFRLRASGGPTCSGQGSLTFLSKLYGDSSPKSIFRCSNLAVERPDLSAQHGCLAGFGVLSVRSPKDVGFGSYFRLLDLWLATSIKLVFNNRGHC